MFHTSCERSDSPSAVCLAGVVMDGSNIDPNSKNFTEELKVLDEVLSSEFRNSSHAVCLKGVDLDESNIDPNSEDVTEGLDKKYDEYLNIHLTFY